MIELKGVFTAIITPFKNGELDLPSLSGLVRRQIEAGVHGLVPLGSTGEAATIAFEERARVIECVLKEARGRVPVLVGTGTNATASTIQLTRQARELGADAAMLVTPYYNRPTPEGIVAHVRAVSDAVDIPLVLYNVPSRTGFNLEPELAGRLAALPRVIGIKEASGNMVQVMEVVRATQGKWAVLSGEDLLFLPVLNAGGKGIICTTSNVAPERFVRLYNLWLSGDQEAALAEQLALFPLIRAMFKQTNPIPVKAAAALMGLCGNEIRLPLVAMSGAALEGLQAELKKFSLL